ncbi:MAG: DUF3047 domain-containing protein [Candidatus Rokuibacteriota bacterium]
MSLRDGLARLGVWRLSVIVVVVAGAIAIGVVPRLRAFYFGQGPARVERAAATLGRLPTPLEASATPGRSPLLPDAEGRIRVRVSDRVPPRLPVEGIPAGWMAREFVGQASVELVRDEARLALRLRSEQSSFALYRDVVVDLNEFPFLSWAWKVVRMPAEGDVRDRATDDQAAQVYVIFPRWPAPLTNSDVVGYVWDSRAPAGTQVTSTQAGNVKIIVVESGRGQVDTWRVEQRDVGKDYAALFGRPAPRVGQVAVMIDTNDTRGVAETLIADLIFARTRAESMESPTYMLR